MKGPKHSSPYLKMRVLGAIDFAEGYSIRDRIRKVAEMSFTDEHGFPRKFTWRTIETWRTRYRNYGITSMINKPRSDKGQRRKMDPQAVLEAVEQVIPFLKQDQQLNKALIYRLCIEKGLLRREEIAPNTFSRFLMEHHLLKNNRLDTEKREAWSKQYANQLWQGDSKQGPFIKINGIPKQTWLIALIDDASRTLTHGEFFFHNDTDSLIKTLQAGIYKRGIPEQLYFDNGSNYVAAEISLVCARTGIILSHTQVRDAAAKGKIERFFRTVDDCFLCRILDLSSLDALNRQFWSWLEEEYNSRVHSSIQMKPVDRFGLDLNRIKYLPPCEMNDELFYLEDGRTVKKDNTFMFKNVRFEAPRDLREKKISIRFERINPDSRVVVYYNNQRMGEAKRLITFQNDKFNKEN